MSFYTASLFLDKHSHECDFDISIIHNTSYTCIGMYF